MTKQLAERVLELAPELVKTETQYGIPTPAQEQRYEFIATAEQLAQQYLEIEPAVIAAVHFYLTGNQDAFTDAIEPYVDRYIERALQQE